MKTVNQPLARSRSPANAPSPGRPADAKPDGVRETVEAFVVAFIFAFLFWTFEAEGFEIPTGSMATTLMGRHKDVICLQCGYAYQVGASEEIDQKTNSRLARDVATATCPICRYTMNVAAVDSQPGSETSYRGDRIWVSKGTYRFTEPQRWDVAVFKFPEGAKENYIKRLVGLPGETIRIQHGDIFVDGARGSAASTIARKPPAKIRAMLQPVYDNDHRVEKLHQEGWPHRWQPAPNPSVSSAEGWKPLEGGKAFRVQAPQETEEWLRYQHIVPSYEDWQLVLAGEWPRDRLPRPQLISDFCHYNTGQTRDKDPAPEARAIGQHWVGDLYLECRLDIEGSTGTVTLELVEGGRRFQCVLDVATGEATLGIRGVESFRPRAATALRGPGRYLVAFANIDDQLVLWIDGSVVEFNVPTGYPPLRNTVPTVDDLSPVGIAARGATLRVDHLRICRDVYYVAATSGDERFSDYLYNAHLTPKATRENIARFLSDPARWNVFRELSFRDFELRDDEFLVLGDNSPNSSDSRFWHPEEFFVRRELLIGKAFFIYWPHAWETHPSIRIPWTEKRFPFYPNFARMGPIR